MLNYPEGERGNCMDYVYIILQWKVWYQYALKSGISF